MNKTYSMLFATDRAIFSVPDRAVVTVLRSAKNAAIRVVAHNDNKRVIIDADWIGGSTYRVIASRFSRLMGKMKHTKTIDFTTSVDWIEQWIEMAQAHAVCQSDLI